MKVRIEFIDGLTEPEAVICTSDITEEVLRAEALLRGGILNGYRENEVTRLPTGEILRIYAERQKVYAETADGVYQLRQRLYTLEEELDKGQFLRISNSEIVNSAAIRRLDISLTGTIGVELRGGIRTYASRRYVKKIKEFLEL